ncbi:hypothetical protein ACFQY7_01925 [Actinomadura luteofluorescens]|uniref:hypothetical protein n=1 Tax=Actinomadura luteofluorescens TaxID=46163 RepID=UPI00362A6AED
MAFYAVGGYTMAIFATRYEWNFWESLGLAIGFSALAGSSSARRRCGCAATTWRS